MSSGGVNLALSIAVLLASLIRTAWITFGGEDSIIVNTPDDAFYYFALARNHAATGRWSFDGVSPATGFHLAWAYCLSALYTIFPAIGLKQLFVVSGVVGSVCFAVAAWAMGKATREPFGGVFVLLGQPYVLLPTMAMEAPFVIAAAGLCTWLVIQDRNPAWAFAVGLFGELARSDFGLVPFALLVATAAVQFDLKRKRSALASCGGAITGLLLGIAHNLAVSGNLLQNSALMKQYWSSVAGESFSMPLALLGDSVILRWGLLGLAPLLLFVIACGVASRRHRNLGVLWLASVMIMVGYVFVYSQNGGDPQVWYLACFFVPAATFLAGTILFLQVALSRKAVAVALCTLICINLWASRSPIWQSQLYMAEAGRLLRSNRAYVGAWNAGILGFYNAGRTVNLDGLVNDDIFPHAKAGTLYDYVIARRLDYIADWGAMLNPDYSRRGGYADGRLARCLSPIRSVVVPAPKWMDSAYVVWKVSCEASPGR